MYFKAEHGTRWHNLTYDGPKTLQGKCGVSLKKTRCEMTNIKPEQERHCLLCQNQK